MSQVWLSRLRGTWMLGPSTITSSWSLCVGRCMFAGVGSGIETSGVCNTLEARMGWEWLRSTGDICEIRVELYLGLRILWKRSGSSEKNMSTSRLDLWLKMDCLASVTEMGFKEPMYLLKPWSVDFEFLSGKVLSNGLDGWSITGFIFLGERNWWEDLFGVDGTPFHDICSSESESIWLSASNWGFGGKVALVKVEESIGKWLAQRGLWAKCLESDWELKKHLWQVGQWIVDILKKIMGRAPYKWLDLLMLFVAW